MSEHLKKVGLETIQAVENRSHSKYLQENLTSLQEVRKQKIYWSLVDIISNFKNLEYHHRESAYLKNFQIVLENDGDHMSDAEACWYDLSDYMILSDEMKSGKWALFTVIEDDYYLYVPKEDVYIWEYVVELGFLFKAIPDYGKHILALSYDHWKE